MIDTWDKYASYCRKTYGAPDGWRVYAAEIISGGLSVTGIVPGVYKRGPKRGQENFRTGNRSTRATYTIPSSAL